MYGIPNETPAMTRKMEECVGAVMKTGKNKSSAIAICKTRLGFAKKSLSDKHDVFVVHNKSRVLELGDNKFKKQLLRFGSWLYGDDVFEVNTEFAKKLVKNFKKKALQNVPVLRGHHTQNAAESNPELVAGWVNDLEVGDDGVYAVFDVSEDAIKDLGTVYKDVSASIDPVYQDHESGDVLGPVVSHVALVIEPYIKGLKSFEKMLSEDGKKVISIEQENGTKIISQNPKMDKEKEVISEVEAKADEKAEEAKTKEEAKEESEEETKEEIAEEAGEKSEDEVAKEPEEETKEETKEEAEEEATETEAEAEEETEEKTDLSEEVERLRKELADVKKAKLVESAQAEYAKLLSEGRIVPAQEATFMELYCAREHKINLADGKEKSVKALFKGFVKHMPKVISFDEKGRVSDEGKADAFKPEEHFSEAEIKGFETLYKDSAVDKMKEAVELEKEVEEKKE